MTLREGLQDKLGPVLFQFPKQVVYTPKMLQRVVQQLNPVFCNVLEFRHESWWRAAVFEQLRDHRLTFCSISYPDLPDGPVVQPPLFYYRFHGAPHLYKSAYADAYLNDIVEQVQQHADLSEVYLYFNNTATDAAIRNARHVQEVINDPALLR